MEGQGSQIQEIGRDSSGTRLKNVREFFTRSVFRGKEGWFVTSAPPALTKKQVKHNDIHPRPSSFLSVLVIRPNNPPHVPSEQRYTPEEISAFLPKGGCVLTVRWSGMGVEFASKYA
jgi:hypothetical protein